MGEGVKKRKKKYEGIGYECPCVDLERSKE
jgi:hypothetical protein